ncbi:MAG TPA: shikimate kinase AroK [Xanthomonadales bacterium]|nr:shikimate kinase AroK [Xanthomonadales bacterium]
MTSLNSNVYLIGPMGSGKTTIGNRVARLLGMAFIDCDAELESRTGASVNLIFDVEGEEGFRKRETDLLEELSTKQSMLIATGGGAVLRQRNRELMSASGAVVYLRTSVAQQLSRLRQDKKRPLLQAPDREERLTKMAKIRNPIYEELADIVFPSQNQNVSRVAKRLSGIILSYLNDAEQAPRHHR